jgi:hypothetical protein
MAKIDINTTVQGPDEITITLVREDYLNTSNTYRIFFEICLAVTAAIVGNLLSFEKPSDIPTLNWIFLGLMILGSIAFIILAIKNFNKAKSKQVNTSPTG